MPSSARVPSAGTVTIFTLASVSPASASMKPKSSAMKVYGLSSPVVTVLLAAVGAVLVVATVESLVTAGTPDMPVVKEATSLPAESWSATVSSPVVGSV